MSSSADKLAFLLEAAHGPLWHGTLPSVNERLKMILGELSESDLQAWRTTYFRWLDTGVKRKTSKSLARLCQGIKTSHGLTIKPEWITDPHFTLAHLAEAVDFNEIMLDYAIVDMKLNQINPEPDLLNDLTAHEMMEDGIWLVTRWADEDRTKRKSTCILVITRPLDFRRDTKGEANRGCHFAYLFTPFGGQRRKPTRRPNATKYVGRGAVIDGSIEFHFSSEGRTPPDKADMRIMASDDTRQRYDGGYVSKNIDGKGRPSVRWIDVTFLDPDVSVDNIDRCCEAHVRAAQPIATQIAPEIATGIATEIATEFEIAPLADKGRSGAASHAMASGAGSRRKVASPRSQNARSDK